jgi:hypothetical protein
LQERVFVQLGNVGPLDDQAARELHFRLGPGVRLAHEEVVAAGQALLVDEQAAFLDRDVRQLQRDEGFLELAARIAVLDDGIGGQLGGGGDLEVDLQQVGPRQDDSLTGDRQALDVRRPVQATATRPEELALCRACVRPPHRCQKQREQSGRSSGLIHEDPRWSKRRKKAMENEKWRMENAQ